MAGRDFEIRIIGDSSSAVQAVETFGSKLKSNFEQGKQAADVFKGVVRRILPRQRCFQRSRWHHVGRR